MLTHTFQVRPVTKYVLTRSCESENGGSVETIGEYDNEVAAHNTALAVARADTHLAQPPDRIVNHLGEDWSRDTGRWSSEAAGA